jgi:hypothetical protein
MKASIRACWTERPGKRGEWCAVFVGLLAVAAIAAAAVAPPREEPTVAQLKARLASTSPADRPHLCLQIAEKQLAEADKQYAASEVEKAQAALTDVVAFSELARDYALQTRKHEKQAEIAVRSMARRLTELAHTLPQTDEAPVKDAVRRLERVRDDLLLAMFPKGSKSAP